MRPSTERERKRFDAGVKERDLERAIDDGPALSNQLIETAIHCGTGPVLVDVHAPRRTGRLAVDRNAKAHLVASTPWAHHQVDVAGVKAAHDPTSCAVQDHRLMLHRPLAVDRPAIQFQSRRD